MSRGDYTVEIYRADKRARRGERLVLRHDHKNVKLQDLHFLYSNTWFHHSGSGTGTCRLVISSIINSKHLPELSTKDYSKIRSLRCTAAAAAA